MATQRSGDHTSGHTNSCSTPEEDMDALGPLIHPYDRRDLAAKQTASLVPVRVLPEVTFPIPVPVTYYRTRTTAWASPLPGMTEGPCRGSNMVLTVRWRLGILCLRKFFMPRLPGPGSSSSLIYSNESDLCLAIALILPKRSASEINIDSHRAKLLNSWTRKVAARA